MAENCKICGLPVDAFIDHSSCNADLEELCIIKRIGDKASESKIRSCGECGEGHCCDGRIISPGALLRKLPKDECADCTDDKRCLMEAGVPCGKGETI